MFSVWRRHVPARHREERRTTMDTRHTVLRGSRCPLAGHRDCRLGRAGPSASAAPFSGTTDFHSVANKPKKDKQSASTDNEATAAAAVWATCRSSATSSNQVKNESPDQLVDDVAGLAHLVVPLHRRASGSRHGDTRTCGRLFGHSSRMSISGAHREDGPPFRVTKIAGKSRRCYHSSGTGGLLGGLSLAVMCSRPTMPSWCADAPRERARPRLVAV